MPRLAVSAGFLFRLREDGRLMTNLSSVVVKSALSFSSI
jgi:hypothetical protein